MDERIKIATPPYIRPEWLKGGPQRTIMDAAGTSLITFDPVHRSGGVYRIEAGFWGVYGPMAFGEFVQALPALGVALPSTDDLSTWIEACSDLSALPTPETRQ